MLGFLAAVLTVFLNKKTTWFDSASEIQKQGNGPVVFCFAKSSGLVLDQLDLEGRLLRISLELTTDRAFEHAVRAAGEVDISISSVRFLADDTCMYPGMGRGADEFEHGAEPACGHQQTERDRVHRAVADACGELGAQEAKAILVTESVDHRGDRIDRVQEPVARGFSVAQSDIPAYELDHVDRVRELSTGFELDVVERVRARQCGAHQPLNSGQGPGLAVGIPGDLPGLAGQVAQ